MQLDDAKKNLQAARETALAQDEKKCRERSETFDRILAEKKALIEEMKAGQEALSAECEKAAGILSSLPRGAAVTAPVAQEAPDRETLVARVAGAMKTAGFDCSEDAALAFLILFAQNAPTGHLGIASESPADALSADTAAGVRANRCAALSAVSSAASSAAWASCTRFSASVSSIWLSGFCSASR